MQHPNRIALNRLEIPVRDMDRAPAFYEPLLATSIRRRMMAPNTLGMFGRVESAGGRITTPEVQRPGDMACFAYIGDSEGNRVGLHALS